MLDSMGYTFTDNEMDADIIVINTCAVREHAEQRIYGNVGALVHSKRNKPEQIIVLCGCMVQQTSVADKNRRSYKHVDNLFGPQAHWRFPELLERFLNERGKILSIDDEPGAIAEGLPAIRDSNVRAGFPLCTVVIIIAPIALFHTSGDVNAAADRKSL